MSTKLPKFGYALWEESESWSDCEGDTFEDAARFALAEEPDADEVWVCEARPVDAVEVLLQHALNAEHVIECAEESRESWPESSASWYDDKLFDDSAESQARLRALLLFAARTWIAQFPGATAHIWESHNPRCVRREEVSA